LLEDRDLTKCEGPPAPVHHHDGAVGPENHPAGVVTGGHRLPSSGRTRRDDRNRVMRAVRDVHRPVRSDRHPCGAVPTGIRRATVVPPGSMTATSLARTFAT
jgi:hypothetical protein